MRTFDQSEVRWPNELRCLIDKLHLLVICISLWISEHKTSEKLIITRKLTTMETIDAKWTNWYRLDVQNNRKIRNLNLLGWKWKSDRRSCMGSPKEVHRTDQRQKWFLVFRSLPNHINTLDVIIESFNSSPHKNAGLPTSSSSLPYDIRASPISTNYHLIDNHNEVVGDNQLDFFSFCHWPRSCSATLGTRILPHLNWNECRKWTTDTRHTMKRDFRCKSLQIYIVER